MEIFNVECRQQKKASQDYFYGEVIQQNLNINAEKYKCVRVLKVSFTPKARTAWHTHPLGQTLFVLRGVGLVGVRNETPKVINKGDSVWIPPNEEHWHGASNDTEMEHIAIQEALDGNVATWLEHVSDDQYYFK